MDQKLFELWSRIKLAGVRQGDIARHLGLHESELSKILNGRRAMPEGFLPRFEVALVSAATEKAESILSATAPGAAR